MAKNKFLKPEYAIVLLVLIGVILLLIPLSTGNISQANFISKWNEKYNRIEYMFSVINAHITDDMLVSMKKAKSPQEREDLLLTIIKPYLRINTENKPKYYKPKYFDGSKIWRGEQFYFEDFYFSENKTILGIKDIQSEDPNDPFFIMMFDINGKSLPNRWGRDIFGINIYDNGKIQPFGFDKDMLSLKGDCSNEGTGLYCSYYYKIGGGFDD